MKRYKFIGKFSNDESTYELEVNCNGVTQAYILLMAKAIESGKHLNLVSIKDENGLVRKVEPLYKLGQTMISTWGTLS